MRMIILFIVLAFSMAPAVSGAEEYSLDELYSIALQNSNAIKIVLEDTHIAEQDRERAMSALIPTLSAFGSSTGNADGGGSIPDQSNAWGLKIDKSLSLSGKELTALKIAEDSIIRRGFDLDAAKEAYLLKVASAYYGVLKARKAFEMSGSNVDRLTKHRDAAQTRLRLGETTKTVLLRAEAELSGAHSDLIRAENALKLAKLVLERTTGIKGGYNLKEDQSADSNQLSAMTVENLKQTAFSERAELKSIRLQKEIAEKQIKYSAGSFWPDISIEGVYSRQDAHPSLADGGNENIYGLVSINYPFFEGGLRKAEVSQAEARLRQADYLLHEAMDTVGLELEDAYLSLATASALIEKLKSEVEYAKDNFNSVTKQFQFGLADSIDVIDANNLLFTSERELVNARYDFEFAAVRLQRAAGTLLKTVTEK
ncbi:MAG: TolC family protein [Nitrospirae bacterium]|nr:TolC family protein [Nitrospirota bacterium]